jgi:PAS domain S-box-containing protein
MIETGLHRGRFSRKYWTMLITILSGLLFPFASILIIILQNKVFFTFKNIVRIHLDNPELFILYILPLIGAYLIHILYTRKQKIQSFFKKIISEKKETINRNAQFANELGKGNYNVDIIPEGEEDVLGRSLLLMKENLLAKSRKESMQNWISEGINMISNILRLYNKLDELGDHVLENLVRYIDAIQGAIYLYNGEEDNLVSLSTYAYHRKEHLTQKFKVGFGLIGQCAYDRKHIYRTEIPADYLTISSGLIGEKKPASLLIVPLISDDALQGVIEIAFMSPEIPEQTIELIIELGDIIARTIFNLRVNQEELERSNEQLEARVSELENAKTTLHWLLENTSEIITIYDKDLKNIYVSPSVSRILGYSPKEYMKGKDFERLTKDDQTRIKELMDMIVKDPSHSPNIQYSYIRKDGQQVQLETKFRNMLEDPSVNGIILNINDITETYRAVE